MQEAQNAPKQITFEKKRELLQEKVGSIVTVVLFDAELTIRTWVTGKLLWVAPTSDASIATMSLKKTSGGALEITSYMIADFEGFEAREQDNNK